MTVVPTRDPYPNELLVWNRLKQRFGVLTNQVDGFVSTAEVSATFQSWITKNGHKEECFNESDQRSVDGILKRYNTLGRLISGAETGKYNIQIKDGDVVIGAPPGMSADIYTPDIYPGAMEQDTGLGGVLLVVGAVGVALIVGAVIAVEALDYSTKSKDHEFRTKVIDTDKQMMSKPKEVRDAWVQMKKASSGLIEKANKKHESSWFGSLGLGSAAGLVVLILGLIVAGQLTRR
ncbi:MAG: hypothetical protein JW704_03510 [Anaerolineaceae bacterium]|nr:hypothetical protein [Anaerolineaceae bacterium]